MKLDRAPRLVRPIEYEYFIIGSILVQYDIWDMTEKQFVALVMRTSGGHFNPKRAKELYHIFMEEAGLKPLMDEE